LPSPAPKIRSHVRVEFVMRVIVSCKARRGAREGGGRTARSASHPVAAVTAATAPQEQINYDAPMDDNAPGKSCRTERERGAEGLTAGTAREPHKETKR
jgi:hypothetical protein